MAWAFFLILACVAPLSAETVVDVSKQWNERASSATVHKVSPPPTPIVKTPLDLQTSTSALQCGCDELSPKERLDDSTYAFTGRVDQTQTVKNKKKIVTFDVQEVFKGSPGVELKVTEELSGTPCDLAFEEGNTYLVFAKWVWGTVQTDRCMGSKFLEKAPPVALGPTESMKEKLYEHLQKACMGRIDTACCLASLKAMRAGYYIPKADESCPEGTVPDRLRCGGSYTWCIPVTEKSHR